MYIHTYVASYLQHTYTNHTLIMKLYSLSNYHTITGLNIVIIILEYIDHFKSQAILKIFGLIILEYFYYYRCKVNITSLLKYFKP